MKLGFCNSDEGSAFAVKSAKNIEGFYRYNRFIVLSDVSSSTIPNIMDLVFNVFCGGNIDMIPGTAKKTKVTVINNSEVYGTYYGLKDARTRSVYVHYGIADCNVDQINGETPIQFTDMDYNVIADRPSELESGTTAKSLGEVRLSYDAGAYDNTLYRDTEKYKTIFTPSPEFYDEKDMILSTDAEEDYYAKLLDVKESVYFNSAEDVKDKLYTLTLNQLIDDHTKVMKLNIKIDNLMVDCKSCSCETNKEMDDLIYYICCQLKYSLEKCGFSGGEIILNGRNGYNITDLRSYLDLNPVEKRINYTILCGDIDDLNERMFGETAFDKDYSLLIHVDYANIKAVIVDLISPVINKDKINKTDSDTREMGSTLKSDNMSEMLFPKHEHPMALAF